ncbi:MAG: hypothetical protein D6719_12250 [Candidatus Dadabacteria bacterium]|nr:MAG: hypothetical protein D6719_12250 [Candidatus Dadabacteria bacterium]
MESLSYRKSVLKLADTLHENCTLRQLENRRSLLMGISSHTPQIRKTRIFSAVHLALLWKQAEANMSYKLN